FTPLPGSPAKISLSNALKPATLQFVYTNPKNPYTYIDCKYQNGKYMQTVYVYSDEVNTGFYMGQEMTYQVHLDDTDLKRYKLPAEKTITLTDQSQIETIVLEPFSMVTVTGKVTDTNISDRSIEAVQVQAVQTVTNHIEKFSHSVSAVTDAQGNYTLSLYADTQADISFYKAGYEVSNVKFTPALQNITLDTGLS
ncbi:MAG TPA: hypothetical protein DDZ89_19910, partial [Clostridiales bacterium]|nr:hypothetical protein [Clostridiales bacterium]